MPPTGNTFRPIDLDVATLMPLNYPEFVLELRKRLRAAMTARYDWYNDQTKRHRWVNPTRSVMVWAGALAALATALAAGLRVYEAMPGNILSESKWDIALLMLAIVLYACVGAAAFLEKGTEGVGGYFRSIMAVIAVRDQWTAYEFKDANLLLELDAPADPAAIAAAKKKWLEAAEAFVKGIDAVATQELTEWRGAFQTAMTQLSTAATTGLAAAQTALGEAVKTDAATAKAAADDAKRAAEAAKAATKSASLNITIAYSGAGKAVVKVDGHTVAQGEGRSFAAKDLTQGDQVVRVEIVDAQGTVLKSAEQVHSFAAGINALQISLT